MEGRIAFSLYDLVKGKQIRNGPKVNDCQMAVKQITIVYLTCARQNRNQIRDSKCRSKTRTYYIQLRRVSKSRSRRKLRRLRQRHYQDLHQIGHCTSTTFPTIYNLPACKHTEPDLLHFYFFPRPFLALFFKFSPIPFALEPAESIALSLLS